MFSTKTWWALVLCHNKYEAHKLTHSHLHIYLFSYTLCSYMCMSLDTWEITYCSVFPLSLVLASESVSADTAYFLSSVVVLRESLLCGFDAYWQTSSDDVVFVRREVCCFALGGEVKVSARAWLAAAWSTICTVSIYKVCNHVHNINKTALLLK